jgi:hypothetical protein
MVMVMAMMVMAMEILLPEAGKGTETSEKRMPCK